MLGFSSTGAWAIFLYVIRVLVLVGTFVSQQHAAVAWLRKQFVDDSESVEGPPLGSVAEPRILSLQPTGGSSGRVDFSGEVANYGDRPCRCTISARVGEQPVLCSPATLDLPPGGQPQLVRIDVPRPELGDLVPEFNHETTLYNETLHVEAVTPDQERANETWHEHVYTPEENTVRQAIQLRKWRIGRGEETSDDRRAEHMSERDRRAAEIYREHRHPYEQL